MSAVSVSISENGEIHTVQINRPGARNAVDGPTARLLADAFRTFDADPIAKVAILCGTGNFCAGAGTCSSG